VFKKNREKFRELRTRGHFHPILPNAHKYFYIVSLSMEGYQVIPDIPGDENPTRSLSRPKTLNPETCFDRFRFIL
jgi:hypothetical protein